MSRNGFTEPETSIKGTRIVPLFLLCQNYTTIQGAEKGVQGFPLPLGEHHRPGTQRAGSYGVIMWRKLKLFRHINSVEHTTTITARR